MLHEEERKEKDYSEIFILHECWVSFILKNSHNIIANFTFIIIYNIVQHHLSDLTSFFSTSFQVTYVKIMTLWFILQINHAVQNLFLIFFEMLKDILKWDFDIVNSLSMFSYDFIMILLQRHWKSLLLQNNLVMTLFHHR